MSQTFTIEQIRKAGIAGEINSIDVEHLISILLQQGGLLTKEELDLIKKGYEKGKEKYDPELFKVKEIV